MILTIIEHGLPLDEVIYREVMFDDTTSGEYPEHAAFIHDKAIPILELVYGLKVTVLRAKTNYKERLVRPNTRGKHIGEPRGFPLRKLTTPPPLWLTSASRRKWLSKCAKSTTYFLPYTKPKKGVAAGFATMPALMKCVTFGGIIQNYGKNCESSRLSHPLNLHPETVFLTLKNALRKRRHNKNENRFPGL